MAVGADKTIKVTIVVDEAAAAKAKRAIQEIKREVDDLVKSTQDLGRNLGAAGGGGFTRVGNQASQPGSSSVTRATVGNNQGKGPLAAITGIFSGVGNNMKGAATGSKEAVREIEGSLKKLTQAAETEARRLEGVFGKIRRLMTGGGNATIGGGAAPVAGSAPGVSNPPVAAKAPRTVAQAFMPGGQYGFANQMMGGGGFGMPTGGPATFGGAAMAGVKIASAAIGLSYGNERANATLDMERAFFGSRARAEIGDTFGQSALSIRRGDFARVDAMRKLANDPTFAALSDGHRMQRREQMLRMDTPTTLMEHISKEGIFAGIKNYGASGAGKIVGGDLSGTMVEGHGAGALTQAKHGFGVAGEWIKGVFTGKGVSVDKAAGRYSANNQASLASEGMFGPKNVGVDEAAQEQARAAQLTAAAKEQEERIQQQMREDPLRNERINSVINRSTSDSALFRSLGMGGRDLRRKIGGQWQNLNAATAIRSDAIRMGYTEGDFGSAAASLSAYGRGYLGHYKSVLSPQAGGLTNAAEIMGMSGQFGKFGGLLGSARAGTGIQSMIGGKTGLDITAGAQLSGTALASMRGNFLGGMAGQGGSGLMETLMTAGYSGQGTGGDMYLSGMVQAGLGRRQQEAGGNVDQLNKALNINAAMKASPQAPWTTRNMLMGMDETQLLDIVKGGSKMMPDMLLDNGVTYDMVVSYWKAKNATSFARFGTSKEYGTQEQRDLVNQYRQAGGLGFLKGKSQKEINRALNILAGADAGAGGNVKAARGKFEIEASAIGIKGKPKGRGAGWGVAKDSVTGAANEGRSEQEVDEAIEESNLSPDMKAAAKNAVKAKKSQEEERRKAQGALASGSNMGQAVMDINSALNNFVKQLQDMVKTSKGGPPPGPPNKAQ